MLPEAGTRAGGDVDEAGAGALGNVDGAVGGGVVGNAVFFGNAGIGKERWAFLHAGVERLGLPEEGRHHDGELDGLGILAEGGGLKFGVGPDSDRPDSPLREIAGRAYPRRG